MKPVEDRFGRVFVRQSSSCEEANNTGNSSHSNYVLLEDHKFSNLYLRPYKNNNVEEDESFTGRRYSLEVLGHRIKTPIPLGKNTLVKTEAITTAFKKQVEAMSKFDGLADGEMDEDGHIAKCKVIEKSGYHIALALAADGHNVEELELLLLCHAISLIDDVLENHVPQDNGLNETRERASKKLSYKLFSEIGRVFSKAFEDAGEHGLITLSDNPHKLLLSLMRKNKKLTTGSNSMTDIKNSKDSFSTLLKALKMILRFYREFVTIALDTSQRNGCSARPLFSSLAAPIDFLCLEYSEEWNNVVMADGRESAVLPLMIHLREKSIGSCAGMEMFLFQYGINLGERLRGTALFKMIGNQLAIYSRKINDFFSFEKELRCQGTEWKSNEACIMHKVMGLSPEQAKSAMVAAANKTCEQIETLCALLLSTWEDRLEMEQVTQFVDMVKFAVATQVHISAFINRYHDNIVMNCYID